MSLQYIELFFAWSQSTGQMGLAPSGSNAEETKM